MPEFSQQQFEQLANQFWFKGVLAVKQVMRNDLLIGLHLALDMVRDCCVLAMVLRDRAEGTDHHRLGGLYNDMIEKFKLLVPLASPDGILDLIEKSSIVFDQLSKEWSQDYDERRQPLIEMDALCSECTICQRLR